MWPYSGKHAGTCSFFNYYYSVNNTEMTSVHVSFMKMYVGEAITILIPWDDEFL